jgi:hypothetical protein
MSYMELSRLKTVNSEFILGEYPPQKLVRVTWNMRTVTLELTICKYPAQKLV